MSNEYSWTLTCSDSTVHLSSAMWFAILPQKSRLVENQRKLTDCANFPSFQIVSYSLCSSKVLYWRSYSDLNSWPFEQGKQQATIEV